MPAIKRPLVIIVRDGWGKNPYPQWNNANAVYLAKHPVADKLMAEYPNVLIHTSGFEVGLPEGTMGNSEVGHQNIGAGRIVDQRGNKLRAAVRRLVAAQQEGVVNGRGHRFDIARWAVRPSALAGDDIMSGGLEFAISRPWLAIQTLCQVSIITANSRMEALNNSWPLP